MEANAPATHTQQHKNEKTKDLTRAFLRTSIMLFVVRVV